MLENQAIFEGWHVDISQQVCYNASAISQTRQVGGRRGKQTR